ncbi:MAG: hypothetical protein A2X94_02945 [Bdellovibrionales bacterium GWB1_55_8]|nr:MAG: hypothetical protein A2X94_02945 [Bdellovibrionales bacterium GWB1_55_8]
MLALIVGQGALAAGPPHAHVVSDQAPSLWEIGIYLYGRKNAYLDIAKWNSIEHPYVIHPGQSLKLQKIPTLSPEQGAAALLEIWCQEFGLPKTCAQRATAPEKITTPSADPVPSTVTKTEAATEAADVPLQTPSSSFGIGPTQVTYNETGLQPISLQLLTAKIATSGKIDDLLRADSFRRWSWGISGYVTATTVSTNTTSASARYLGLNARITYQLPWPTDRWSASISGGWFYTSMWGSIKAPSAIFGFRDQRGPQALAALSRALSSAGSGSIYVKFTPFVDGFEFSSESGELASGMSYTHLLKNRRAIILSIDRSVLNIQLRSHHVSSESFSFGASLAW